MQAERQRSRVRKWRFQGQCWWQPCKCKTEIRYFSEQKNPFEMRTLSLIHWCWLLVLPLLGTCEPSCFSKLYIWSQPLLVQKVNIWQKHLSWDSFRTISEAALMSFSTSCYLALSCALSKRYFSCSEAEAQAVGSADGFPPCLGAPVQLHLSLQTDSPFFIVFVGKNSLQLH